MTESKTNQSTSPSTEGLSQIERLFAGQKGPLPMDNPHLKQDKNEKPTSELTTLSEQDESWKTDPFGVKEQIRKAFPDLTEEELKKHLSGT